MKPVNEENFELTGEQLEFSDFAEARGALLPVIICYNQFIYEGRIVVISEFTGY